MKILFAGTPDFAATSLDALIAHGGHEIVGVLTQPDRRSGRGRKLSPPPVKVIAEQARLPVLQPARARDPEVIETLRALDVDVMVVVAYGQILNQALIDLPRLGTINVHASLLPRWRGAAPIQRAIIAGDPETGVCIMQVVLALDAGPVILCSKTPIAAQDTQLTLHDRLADLGAQALLDALAQAAVSGRFESCPQPEDGVTYARKIGSDDLPLDWQQPAAVLERRVRALTPRPGASATLLGIDLKILEARVVEGLPGSLPGDVQFDRQGLRVRCAEDALEILTLKPAGKKAMTVQAFLNGLPAKRA